MRAVELGSTDIHLKVGQPPVCRIDGDLHPMANAEPLDDAALASVLEIIGRRSPEKIQHFHDSGDLDIAYQDGDLPRFRVNAYRQRSSTSFAFRVIPKTVPTFEQLNMPRRRPAPRRRAPRPDPRHRRDRLGKDDDARGDHRLHEPQPEAAHHHDRGPDRDPAPGPRLHRQPARGRARHRVVRPGATACAAPGPRHDPDRRAP